MKHIKLFEGGPEDGDGFEGERVSDESLRKLLDFIYASQGIRPEDDELEIMLKWSAEKFNISPDEVEITSIDEDRAKDIMQRGQLLNSCGGLRDLGKSIDVLKYFEVCTKKQYSEILDRLAIEHPKLFPIGKRLSSKNQWRQWDLIHEIKSKQYGVVLAFGPAGIYMLTPRDR